MGLLKGLLARTRAATHPTAGDSDLGEEIRFHIDLETEKNIRLGMTPAEARRIAVAHFGGVQRVREEHRDVRRLQWVEDFAGDLRFALRSLRRTPGLASAAILTLALGIGANVAIFSAVNAVVLRPLPFATPDRLVMLAEENPEKQWHLQVAAPANYLDWRSSVTDFQDVMGYADGLGQSTLTGQGDPRVLRVSSVTGNFFSVLGLHAALGRTFRDEETWHQPVSPIVISDRAWRDEFGADRSIVGRSVVLDGHTFQVIGVMPPGVAFPRENVDVWHTIGWTPAGRASVSFRRAHYLRVVARLEPGATLQHADAQLQGVVARLKRDYPETNQFMGASMTPLHEFLVGDTRLPLLVLLTSVAFLLLIACANVGNLLLVQASGRQREAALRLALGAGRSRLVRQSLTESLMLSALGGAIGLALGVVGTRALVALQPRGMLRVSEFGVDRPVLFYVVLITLASSLVFGTAPALWLRHRDPADTLKDGGRGAGRGVRTRRWASALVVGEVALALLMTVGAGLLVRSLWHLRRVDPGFDSRGVLAANITLGRAYDTTTKVEAFTNALVERVRALPGVTSVALSATVPLGDGGYTMDVMGEGRPANAYGSEVAHRAVSPGYLRTLAVPLLRGRGFTAQDRSGAPPVTLINEALAQSYYPGENPVGRRIAFDKVPTPTSTWYTIVGVIGNERSRSLDAAPRGEVIVPMSQDVSNDFNVLIRTSGDAAAVGPFLRMAVRELDPTLAILSLRTLEELRVASMAKARFLTTLLLVFAAIGLVLSVVGVYGVLAQVTRNRTREMGIRIALGAQSTQVRWLVVRQGLALTVAGLLLGGAGALVATRAMRKLLFNVAPNDPATLLAVALILAATSVLAAWIPAVKASRSDPCAALRAD
jgi:predicted permease